MANHGRKFARALALAALCLLLGGCAMNVSTDKLYALPSLPAEYASLEAEINALLSDGAEHAAPISGSNLQSVQMVDLDGDGVEEAVAFFRKATDERPVKIYFFRSNGDSYEQMALIEGTASSIYSITYYDLDGDGRREILVGFKSGTELQVLAVYTLRGSEPLNLLTTAYLRYAVSDLDGDGRQELTVLYSGEENRCMADCYTWDDRELSCISTLELSFSASELSRVAAGALSDEQQALYVTGVADNSVAAYDILTVKNGVLRNVTQNTASSAVDGGFRFLSLYPTDIDGLIELRNREYIILEVKHRGAAVPYGQRLAIERMVDDFTTVGKSAVAIICEHQIDDPDKPVVAAYCKVREIYYGNEHMWRQPDDSINVRQAIDCFCQYTTKKKGG